MASIRRISFASGLSRLAIPAAVVLALAVLPGPVAGAATDRDYSFRDDFSGYAPGSDGMPGWSSEYYGWKTGKGIFVWGEESRGCAVVRKSPVGRLVSIESDMVLRRATGSSWKIAGIRLQNDEDHYWHLALVEAPDADGKRHFVELSEMLGGTWNAHLEPGTRLEPSQEKGQDFSWEYGKPYRLKVELKPGEIRGSVSELDGTVRTEIGYKLAGKAVDRGRPGLEAGGFLAEFSRFSARIGMKVAGKAVKKAALPRYEGRSCVSIKGRKTGFFHAEKIGGTWWIIDPAGNGTFITGVDHASYEVHWCEKLGYAPYHRNCEKLYGSEEKWADSTVARLKSWGFNSLGVNSSQSIRRRGLAHMEILGLGQAYARRDAITKPTTWTGFPNVFNPDFKRYCEKECERMCAPLRDDPWFVGYFIDNELEWHPWTGKGPFGDAFAKAEGHSAKSALVDFLTKRHPSPAAFNAAWGTAIADFKELARMTELPEALTDAAKADVREFVRLAAETYFSTAVAAIRKYDPNHMIMGCRFAGQAPEILDIAGRYSDVISANFYRNVDLETGAMTDGFEKDLSEWYARGGRPMIITEWSFPALDAGLPCKHGAGQRVPTQSDKAFAWTAFQKLLFTTPFVVGSNYFMWADEPELGISTIFPEDSNYGLVNVNDEPYELVTKAAAALNPLACEIHSGAVTDAGVTAGSGLADFVVKNSGAAAGRFRITVRVDGVPDEREVELGAGQTAAIAPPAGALDRPGTHFVRCRVDPVNPLIEKSMADNTASRTVYTPGASWSGKARSRLPILAMNPSGKEVADASVSIALDVKFAQASGFALYDAVTGEPVSFQVDRLEGSTELSLVVPKLGPYGSKSFFLYQGEAGGPHASMPVVYRKTGDGFTATNGILTLVKKDLGNGRCFDRIETGGVELGWFHLLVWQWVGQNQWVAPDRVERIEASNGPVRLVIDMTVSRGTGTGPVITTAGEKGKQEVPTHRQMSYRAKFRFVIYPGSEWFSSRLMWIENTDREPWKLAAYYHYAVSNIGGNAADDEAKAGRWFDSVRGFSYGIVPGSRDIKVYFWKDEGGMEHPDASRDLNVVLQPGERYSSPEPVAYVVGCKENAFVGIEKRLGSAGKITTGAFPAEIAP
jgi:hypothetical protein